MNYTTEDFKKWGAQGGAKSKRTLTTEQSLAMLKMRKDARRMKRTRKRTRERMKG